MGILLTYLAVTGLAANGLKVIRHAGRAAALACRGCYVEAGSELLTAAVAPADAVAFQAQLLIGEVYGALCKCRHEHFAQEAGGPVNGWAQSRFTVPAR